MTLPSVKTVLSRAEKKGACDDGKLWLLEQQGTPKEILARAVRESPINVLWAAGKKLFIVPKATLVACAKKEPYEALQYAARLLPKATLVACAEKEPYAALTSAARLLPKATLVACAEKEPWTALEYEARLLPKALQRRLEASCNS